MTQAEYDAQRSSRSSYQSNELTNRPLEEKCQGVAYFTEECARWRAKNRSSQ